MPNSLIVAATRHEVSPLIRALDFEESDGSGLFYSKRQKNTHLLITGVGMVNTAFALGQVLPGDYNLIINAGICGAFNRRLTIGELVLVQNDALSEMGAEDGDEFITYRDLGLGGENNYSASNVKLPVLETIKQVNGITVNRVHGNLTSIKKVVELFNPDVESMEGAAFLRACGDFPCRYHQLRAISNYVELRDKSKWNIPLAVEKLNSKLLELITSLHP